MLRCVLGYRELPMGGDDTLTAPWHFPLPELLPISRPEASRNWVRLPLPANPLVVALPVVRPLASR